MNKSLVTIDCTLSCLFEMQNELFHLRKNTFRQAQEAHLTHSSLSQVNRWMRAGFRVFLLENVFDWRPTGREGVTYCSSGGLQWAGPGKT